jgi:hypothetical protein
MPHLSSATNAYSRINEHQMLIHYPSMSLILYTVQISQRCRYKSQLSIKRQSKQMHPTEYHQMYTQIVVFRQHYTRNSFINPSPLSRTSYLSFGGNASYFALLIPIISSNSSSLRKYYYEPSLGREYTSIFSISTPRGRVSP